MKENKHLTRLSYVWISNPCYFITVCVNQRRPLLASALTHEILRKHLAKSLHLYGWSVGSYVIMPDHVHFFCIDAESKTKLSKMIGSWKEWTSKEICKELGIRAPLWQREFFDHLLRTEESYAEKWNYVKENPARKGLVKNTNEWPFSGYIDYI